MIEVVKLDMYDRMEKRYVTVEVEVVVDVPAVARWLGGRAFANTSGKARSLGGAVIVQVRPKA